MQSAALVIALAKRGAHGLQTPLPLLPSSEASDEWAKLLELAVEHRVAPLVWRGLADAPATAVPAHVRETFEARRLWSYGARMLAEHTLASLLLVADAVNIHLLVLKGPALAHTLYPEPELRPYHDLDVLCHADDHERLVDVLRTAGYEEESVRGSSSIEGGSLPVRSVTDPNGTIDIEIHADMLQLGLVERHSADLWREAQSCACGTCTIRILAPGYQLLHLTAHAHRHSYSRLLWLIDLDLLIRQQAANLPMQQVMQLARDEGVGAVVRHALAVTQAVLGTPIPDLGPPTAEERVLGLLYRCLWPHMRVLRLHRHERRRLLYFRPQMGDLREVLYGFILLGRRWEKWSLLLRHWWHVSRQQYRRLAPR